MTARPPSRSRASGAELAARASTRGGPSQDCNGARFLLLEGVKAPDDIDVPRHSRLELRSGCRRGVRGGAPLQPATCRTIDGGTWRNYRWYAQYARPSVRERHLGPRSATLRHSRDMRRSHRHVRGHALPTFWLRSAPPLRFSRSTHGRHSVGSPPRRCTPDSASGHRAGEIAPSSLRSTCRGHSSGRSDRSWMCCLRIGGGGAACGSCWRR